jgi:hypothetical protein
MNRPASLTLTALLFVPLVCLPSAQAQQTRERLKENRELSAMKAQSFFLPPAPAPTADSTFSKIPETKHTTPNSNDS